MKKLLVLLFVIFGFGLGIRSAHALEFRSGEMISISEDASVSGSLVATGRSVTIKGFIPGDLFCAGQHVAIDADIDGDVICGAQTLSISGRVNGDVRLAGQDIRLSDVQISRNATLFGQDIILDAASGVRGEITTGAQHFETAGIIGKGITGGAQTASINGSVMGTVQMYIENLTLGDRAKLTGDLKYQSDSDASIAPTATVSGSIQKTLPQKPKAEKLNPKIIKESSWAGLLSKILIFSLIGIALVKLFPAFSLRVTDAMETQTLKSFGFGFLSLFIIPVVLVLFAVTIIGIPVTIFGFLLWLFLLFMSRIFVTLTLGKFILRQWKSAKQTDWVWIVVVGVVISTIVFKLPGIGGLLSFLAVIWGFGGFLLTLPWFSKKSKPVKKLAN